MDLRQLEFVVAVADAGGFTAGAAVAHVAQPSLSARVRDLETELGVELFHRLSRGVQPSAAGEVVIDHARAVLADVAALRSAAADVAGLLAGTLDLAALPTLAVDPLADLIGRFRVAHPAVTIRVSEADDAGGSGGVAGQVRSGRAELGVVEVPIAAPDLEVVALADQELLVVFSADTSLGDDGVTGPVALRRLAGAPLVLTPPGTSSRRVVEAAFAAYGLEVTAAVEVAQREAIVPLVLAGAGIGFLPRAQAEAARAQGASVASLRPRLVRSIGMLRRRGRPSPAARAFLALATAGSVH
jgi:LysR family transcriptional regulator, carnitine catabolism transcriptional activator